MNSQIIVFCLLLNIFAAITPSVLRAAPVTVEDDAGNTITLNQPATRIISLSPHITETLFTVGAGKHIIGTVNYSDYPAAAKTITRIGDVASLDLERIVSLNPQLVIVWQSGYNSRQIEKLKQLNIPVFMSEPREIAEITTTMLRFGRIAGTDSVAKAAAQKFEQQHRYLIKRFSGKKTLKVFYQIWNKPLMTINGTHLISKVINLCGGKNIFAGLQSLTPSVSVEAIIQQGADVIIAGGVLSVQDEWTRQWQYWKQIPAVANRQIYFIDASLMHRVGPRILQGAEQMCLFLEKTRQ